MADIELEVLSRAIMTGGIDQLISAQIEARHFNDPEARAVFETCVDHYSVWRQPLSLESVKRHHPGYRVVPCSDELGYLIQEFRYNYILKFAVAKALDNNRDLELAERGNREVLKRIPEIFMERAREVAVEFPATTVERFSDMSDRIKTIKAQQEAGQMPGVPTGMGQLDHYVRSIQVGEFFVHCGFSGKGKGLALDTPLPTPSGWTTMGEVEVGDVLFDEEGKPCRVTNTSPIRRLDCYRVKFSDGTELIADGDHLWQGFITKATVY